MLDHSKHLFNADTDVRVRPQSPGEFIRMKIRLVDEACGGHHQINQYRIDLWNISFTTDTPTASDAPAIGQRSYYVLAQTSVGYIWGNPQLVDVDFHYEGKRVGMPRFKSLAARSIQEWLGRPLYTPQAHRGLPRELRMAILGRLAEFEKARYDAAQEAREA